MMKTKFLFRSLNLILIAVTAIMMTQCSSVTSPTVESAPTASVQPLVKLGTLDEQEIADILYLREEEKMARDVYLLLYAQWGIQVHDKIAQSEQNHMDAMGNLIIKYGLTDPVPVGEPVGVFVNSEIRALFEYLMDLGMSSKKHSLEAGVIIEETDLADIQEAINHVDGNPDIVKVYEFLLAGSESHLAAFLSHLE